MSFSTYPIIDLGKIISTKKLSSLCLVDFKNKRSNKLGKLIAALR